MSNFETMLMFDKLVAAKKTPEDLKKNPPLIHVVVRDPKDRNRRKVVSVKLTSDSFKRN